MKSILAITGGEKTPSARFRVRQHIESLRCLGVSVDEFYPFIDRFYQWKLPFGWKMKYIPLLYPVPAAIGALKIIANAPAMLKERHSDLIWLSKSILPGYCTMERLFRKPIVFDVDDSIWLTGRYGKSQVAHTARIANTIIAGNNYLAEWMGRYNKNIHIVPTAVDTDRFQPRDSERIDEEYVIGWIGTSSNFKYLVSIVDALDNVLKHSKRIKLFIVADRYPVELKAIADRLVFEKWNEKTEVACIQRMDVGIMPLDDDEWTRGKCSFKMLQYMSCGLPVVVSPIGMNKDVLAQGNVGLPGTDGSTWSSALIDLFESTEQRHLLGGNGRKLIESRYSLNCISHQLAEVFERVK